MIIVNYLVVINTPKNKIISDIYIFFIDIIVVTVGPSQDYTEDKWPVLMV